MNFKIKQNKYPNLKMPSFSVDDELSKKLNDFEITKLMNKSNFSLFLGRAGSGKTSLLCSFLKTKNLFNKVYHNVFLFMPSNSRASIKDNFFDKHLPEQNIFSDVNFEDLNNVYSLSKEDAKEGFKTLIIFDDTQRYLKNKDVQKLLLHIINNRRHARISIWMACQNYFSIPLQVRSGLTDLFIFKVSKKEMLQITEEHLEHIKDIENITKHVYIEPHTFLYLNTNTQKLFRNWDEILIEDF